MRVVTEIAAGGGVSVAQVSIRAQTPRWSEPEAVGGHALLAEPAVAYAGGPGVAQSIAHRVGADDAVTAVTLAPELMAGLVATGLAAALLAARSPRPRRASRTWPRSRPGSA